MIEGFHEHTTYPWQNEYLLQDNGAPDQEGELETDERHYRDERILDGVSQNDDPLLEPLRPGRPDVVLPKYLQHHGARHPHGFGRHGRPQYHGRNEEHAKIPQRVFLEENQLHRWRPAPPDCRVEHDHDCQPEVRRGQADDGDGAPCKVGGRILANRRVDADGQGDDEPDYDCHGTKLNGDWQSMYYPFLYLPTPHRVAKGALEETSEPGLTGRPAWSRQHSYPASVLHVDGHVQSQHTLNNLTLSQFRAFHAIQHNVYCIAGDEAHREKDYDGQDKQGGDYQQ